MKRQNKPRPYRRLVLEKLEDRNLPGDTLGWLLPSLLGQSLFPVALSAEPGPFDNLSPRAVARRLNLADDARTSAWFPFLWDDARLQNQRGGGPAVGVSYSSAGAAVQEEVSPWEDVLPTLLLFGDQASAPRFAGGGRAFAAAASGGTDAMRAGAAADGAGGARGSSAAAPAAPTGGVSLSVQSPQEIAAIGYYNSRHAAYEDAHPHSHMGYHHTAGDIAPAAVETAPDLNSPTSTPTAGAAPLGAAPLGAPSSTGQWGPVLNWPLVAVHAHMLPTGKVLLWAYGEDPRRLWDPATDTIAATIPAGPGYNVFCVGHAFLGDGRLLVVGGHVQNGWGLPNASIYDPVADTWSRLPDMNAGRWYPTATALANGDLLVVSGSMDTNYTNNSLPQVWQAGSGTWRDLTSARLNMPLYPSMFVAPNGKVFNAGPAQMARYLDTSGTGAWTDVAANNFGYRDYGTAVMYEPGKVLLVGGGNPPTATAEVIDLNAPTPTWRQVAPMVSPRRQLNATLLPDGKVLVTGGSSAAGFNNEAGAVLTAELWNPATETWTTMASMTQYRGYHSTALLLPDGRVLSAGGDNHSNAEVFSPPYLFQGSRPTVASAPTRIAYGQSFSVETPDAASITEVTLIRLSSVTHAFNENQRLNTLSHTAVAGGLNVTAPANANLAPAGDYMLFVLNSNGVPSVAKIVRMAADGGVPLAPSSLTASAVSPSQVNLAWADKFRRRDRLQARAPLGHDGQLQPDRHTRPENEQLPGPGPEFGHAVLLPGARE